MAAFLLLALALCYWHFARLANHKRHPELTSNMTRTSFLVVVLLFGIRGVPWCQCPKDVVPPDVVQLQDELGVRPLGIAVGELHLTGATHATVNQQREIAASIASFCFPENRRDLVAMRLRAEFQRRGFFKARILAITIAKPDFSAKPPTVSVTVQVDDGERYRLKAITIRGNRKLSSSAALRRLFPMRDGDIFDPEKVRAGLENLRAAYSQFGFFDSTPVPDTQVDTENKLITLAVDVDEGSQFYVKPFSTRNADPQHQSLLQRHR